MEFIKIQLKKNLAPKVSEKVMHLLGSLSHFLFFLNWSNRPIFRDIVLQSWKTKIQDVERAEELRLVSGKQEEKMVCGVGPHNSVGDGMELETGQWERGGWWEVGPMGWSWEGRGYRTGLSLANLDPNLREGSCRSLLADKMDKCRPRSQRILGQNLALQLHNRIIWPIQALFFLSSKWW